VSEGLFGPAYESSGPSRSPHGHRRYLLEINGGLLNGQLRVDWTYSSRAHGRATIEAVANTFIAALQALIAHCQSPDAGSYTPSDFPDEDLSADDLDNILAQISKI
jgi:non-ribosomal peptide synthase protein (TIGR01720 family)